jgi:SOS-response transcriptional repressor LexA
MTPRQHEALKSIEKFINEKGYSPSYEELMPIFNIKSKSGVNRLVMQLVDRGKIKFLKYRARSIELINGS